MNRTTAGVIAAVAVTAVVIAGVLLTRQGPPLTYKKTIPTTGTVTIVPMPRVLIEIYQEEACINPLKAINWGTIENGSSASCDMWIRNEGNMNSTLSFTAGNYTPPEASDYLILSFFYDRTLLPFEPNAVLPVTVVVGVSSDALEGPFDVDLVFTTTQT